MNGRKLISPSHSADEAAQRFADAGGTVVVPPFDIQIGRCTRRA